MCTSLLIFSKENCKIKSVYKCKNIKLCKIIQL